MPAKPMTERFVQNAVAEQLNRRYYRRKPVYESTEVYTRLKRADVLLAFMRTKARPYVVVVEAKSRTTIHQLKLKDNREKVLWTGRIVALALIVGLSAALGYQWYFNALNTLLLLALFIVGAVAVTALISRLELGFLRSISAIEQLGTYPANESWIAVGEDTFVKPAEYRTLRSQCRKNGVGLIVVTDSGKLQLKVIPRPGHVFNDYLGRYGKRAEILKKIDRNPRYGPTPPERAKTRRQLTRATLLLAGVGVLCLIGYEENYGPLVPDPFVAGLESSKGVVIDASPTELPTAPFGENGLAPPETEPCADFGVTERSFIVVDAIGTREAAQRRANELTVVGMRGHGVLAAECFRGWLEDGRFVVYTGEVYPNQPAANRAARSFRELTEQLGRPSPYGKAMKVYPGK